jgi:hypothetical protein
VVSGGTIYLNGSSVGSIPGADRVRFAASPTQVIAVSEGTAYLYDGVTLNSVAQTKAAQGLLGSGGLATALDQYGTGLAQQFGQQYVGDLQNEVGTGEGAANALAGQGESYAGQVSANNNNAATASGNAGLASANAFNAAIGSTVGALGLSKGGTSFLGGGAGAPSSYNAFAPIGG